MITIFSSDIAKIRNEPGPTLLVAGPAIQTWTHTVHGSPVEIRCNLLGNYEIGIGRIQDLRRLIRVALEKFHPVISSRRLMQSERPMLTIPSSFYPSFVLA